MEINDFLKNIYIYFLLHFRFWGTCAEHAGLLQRYIHGNLVCCLHPRVICIWHFSPLQLPTPCWTSSSPPWQIPMYDAPLLVFSLFNTCLWMRTCGVWFSVLVSVCWKWWFLDSSMSLQRTWTHNFLWLHNIPWCVWATFSFSSLSSMGIWVGCRSLLCRQCYNEHMYACVFLMQCFIILWVYTL